MRRPYGERTHFVRKAIGQSGVLAAWDFRERESHIPHMLQPFNSANADIGILPPLLLFGRDNTVIPNI